MKRVWVLACSNGRESIRDAITTNPVGVRMPTHNRGFWMKACLFATEAMIGSLNDDMPAVKQR